MRPAAPSQLDSEDTMVSVDDAIKVSQSGILLPKASSLSFEHPRQSTIVTPARAAHPNHAVLPSPVTDDSHSALRRRRRGGLGFHARLRREWDGMRAAWRGLGFGGSNTPLELIDVDTVVSTSHTPTSPCTPTDQDYTDDAEVDEVIVDNLTQASTCNTHSEAGHESSMGDDVDDVDTLGPEQNPSRRRLFTPYYLFRRTVWKGLRRVFATRFAEPALEERYQHETWIVSKPHAATSALFLLINWILCLALSPRPLNLSDKIFFFGVGPFTSLCPAAIILSDIPTKRPVTYQLMIGVATWSWGWYQLWYLVMCGFYSPRYQIWESCSGRDFIALFYWACALPTIGLFGLKMTRFTNAVCATIFIILTSVFVVPYRRTWIRNVIDFAAFNIFLIYTHYVRERNERRLYILQDHLIMQVKQTQKAQKNERAEADSKRRLTSYVFHEVRVPLNTALLAAQNLQASLGAVAQTYKLEFTALSGSLNQMSAVLNDILDFNRMESGKFVFVAHPFSFHTTMRSLFVPLKLSAEARKLRFVTDLDPFIDRAATKTSVEGDTIGVGVFVGDEQRLRQVVTNLASNACKFTPAGGEVRIATTLLEECPSGPERDTQSINGDTARASEDVNESTRAGSIIVRIEITDTGSGIHRKDMIESKLFSSFSQTEQGRLQGGKGTGLGLAIVRQIVQLSGGRLRVRSRVGVGTTFSVDIPLRLQALEDRSSTPAGPSSDSRRPVTPNSRGSPHLGLSTASPSRSTARMLADPILSPPAHVYHSSQLMSLARVQPMRLQSSVEEEVAAAHAAASFSHMHALVPTVDLGSLPVPADAFAIAAMLPQAGPLAPENSFARGLRVLVVDDDNMTRTLMRRMLSRNGCVVDVAENGQVALDALSAGTPAPDPGPDTLPHGTARYAVVFLDNQMPVLGGLDVVRALRKGGHSVFVVGVTGNALVTDQREFLDAGADHVLTKPVYERDLKKMLMVADERRKAALGANIMPVQDPPS